ncbi:MAG: TolC family protein [Sideroxydans sp.]|nr:TolC family protein [Sideroxydans sp.]
MTLGSCAIYHPQPLDKSRGLASSIHSLHASADQSALPMPKAWNQQSIDLKHGLSETETAVLAVLNSPRLEAARAELTEAKASLYAAGLLPDPQAQISLDYPTSKGPNLSRGESFGLGIDLQKLLTLGARRDAASERVQATYLNILWQEWQVVQQARMLWRRALIQQQQITLLQDQFQQARSTWQEIRKALALGNSTLDQEGLALAPMMSAQAAVKEALRQFNATMHDLHLLLGLDPSVPLVLSGPKDLSSQIQPPMRENVLQSRLDAIAQRRPDLLALQAGYASQENTVRVQILEQFPSFSVGINRSRDTSGIWTTGPFINLNLPIFNRNKGGIAVARATRMRLRQEYRYGLASAYVQASKIAKDQQIAYSEWLALSKRMPKLEETEIQLSNALTSGEIDLLAFTTLRTAYFSQKMKVLLLDQELLEQEVAIETLTGTLLPSPHEAHF